MSTLILVLGLFWRYSITVMGLGENPEVLREAVKNYLADFFR